MKRKLFLLLLVIFIVSTSTIACSTESQTSEAEKPAEEVAASEQADASAAGAELAAAKAAEEAATAAQTQAQADAEKAAEEKAEAEKLLAEAKTAEEKAAAEKLLAEKLAAEQAAAQELARAEAEKLAAQKTASAKAAAQAAAAQANQKAAATKTATNAQTATQARPAIDTKPVTLKVWDQHPFTDEHWEKLIVAPLKAKYPHITLERTKFQAPMNLMTLVAGGYKPDILISGWWVLPTELMLDIPMPLDDLAKKFNTDLSQFKPEMMDGMRGFADGANKGKLMGLPYASNTAVLLYNKDIFDRFGVPYPKDGITFNQTVELSKKLTRLHEGTQYYGMVPSNLKPMVEQLSIDKINLKTHEANFINDGMKKIMQHQLDIYNIPGYDFNKITFQQGAKFFRDKNIGMVSTAFLGLTLLYSKDLAAMNWDMVTTPQWEDRPGIGTKVDAHSFQISRESKHKEQAYLAIEYLTASKEAQTNFSRSGWISVLKDPEIINQLSADNPVMKGKNMVKAISLKPAPNLIFHEYENLVVPKLLNVVKQMVVEKVDINTALRTNQEELTKDIKARMKK